MNRILSNGLPLIAVFAAVVALLGAPKPATAQNNACNCVLYARSQVPSLPFGLNTQPQKAAIINSYTPSIGAVAVFSYNHVAVVTRVETIVRPSGNYVVVTITEANYIACQIGTRRGIPASLGIIGYFRP